MLHFITNFGFYILLCLCVHAPLFMSFEQDQIHTSEIRPTRVISIPVDKSYDILASVREFAQTVLYKDDILSTGERLYYSLLISPSYDTNYRLIVTPELPSSVVNNYYSLTNSDNQKSFYSLDQLPTLEPSEMSSVMSPSKEQNASNLLMTSAINENFFNSTEIRFDTVEQNRILEFVSGNSFSVMLQTSESNSLIQTSKDWDTVAETFTFPMVTSSILDKTNIFTIEPSAVSTMSTVYYDSSVKRSDERFHSHSMSDSSTDISSFYWERIPGTNMYTIRSKLKNTITFSSPFSFLDIENNIYPHRIVEFIREQFSAQFTCFTASPACGCKQICHVLQNCCRREQTLLQETKLEVIMTRRHLNCEKISSYNENDRNWFYNYVYLVTLCPDSWPNDQVRHLCENPDRQQPIETIPVNNEYTDAVYRNRFCAICHGENLGNLSRWKLIIQCPKFYEGVVQPLSLFQERQRGRNQTCDYEYSKINGHVHFCFDMYPEYVNECPTSYKGLLNSLCHDIYEPIVISFKSISLVYKNIYCFQCSEQFGTPVDSISVANIGVSGNTKFTGFQAIFDFSVFLGTDITMQTPCSTNKVYLNREIGCVDLHCTSETVVYRGECINKDKVLTRISGVNINIPLYVNGSAEDFLIRRTLLHYLTSKVKELIYVVPPNKLLINTRPGMNMLSGKACKTVTVEAESIHYKITSSKMREVHLSLKTKMENISRLVEGEIYIKYNRMREKRICEDGSSNVNVSLISFFGFPSTNNVNCPSIKLDINQSNETNGHRQSSTYTIGNRIIQTKDTYSFNGSRYMCISIFLEKYNGKPSFDEDLYFRFTDILYFVCSVISVISLLITVLHFIYIESLRTLQSVLTVHLMAILSIAQIAFIVSSGLTSYHDVCYWYGVFVHFLYLSMFFSMTFCALELTIQLRSSYIIKKRSFKSFLGLFILPCYFLAFLIVLSSTLFNFLHQPDVVWYGERVCFLSNQFGLFYFFGIPVAVIIVVNLVLFSILSFTLCSVKFTIDSSANFTRNNFLILVKLSTLMGFSWIFGFLASISNLQEMWFIFELTCSLQGTFVSFSFLSNAKVRDWYKAKVMLCKKR